MGRQHTIYLSDTTWNQLESLKKEDKSMSETIRMAIDICAQNQEQFDFAQYQVLVIEAYKRRVKVLEAAMCKKCHVKLVD